VRYVVQANSSVRFFKGGYQDPTSHVALPLQVAMERAFARLALQREPLPFARALCCWLRSVGLRRVQPARLPAAAGSRTYHRPSAACAGPQLPWRVSFRDFPHPQLQESSRSGLRRRRPPCTRTRPIGPLPPLHTSHAPTFHAPDPLAPGPARAAAGRIAPVFILASLMFNFVAQLSALAYECEAGTRKALAAAGMLDSAYWSSAALLEVLLAGLQAGLILLTAWALRFDLVSAAAAAGCLPSACLLDEWGKSGGCGHHCCQAAAVAGHMHAEGGWAHAGA
jgi:hypothetical protein